MDTDRNKVERVIEAYVNGEYPADVMRKVELWLVDDSKSEEKDRAMLKQWDKLWGKPGDSPGRGFYNKLKRFFGFKTGSNHDDYTDVEEMTGDSNEDVGPHALSPSPGRISHGRCGWERHSLEANASVFGEPSVHGKIILVLAGKVILSAGDECFQMAGMNELVYIPAGVAWYADAAREGKARIMICDCGGGTEGEVRSLSFGLLCPSKEGLASMTFGDKVRRLLGHVELFLRSGIDSQEWYERQRRELFVSLGIDKKRKLAVAAAIV